MVLYVSRAAVVFLLVIHDCVCVPCSTLCTDFGGSGEEVEVVEVQEYVGDPAYGTATTQLHKVDIQYLYMHIQVLCIHDYVYACVNTQIVLW